MTFRSGHDNMGIDDFTLQRLCRLVDGWKARHGRDVTEAELAAAGFDAPTVDGAMRQEVLARYQATTAKGSVENRFRVAKDWRSLNR